MEIETYNPSQQRDIAVDLGVVPQALPEIESLTTDDTDEHRY